MEPRRRQGETRREDASPDATRAAPLTQQAQAAEQGDHGPAGQKEGRGGTEEEEEGAGPESSLDKGARRQALQEEEGRRQ